MMHVRSTTCGLSRLDERILLKSTSFRDDVLAAIRLLREKDWLHEKYTILDAKKISR